MRTEPAVRRGWWTLVAFLILVFPLSWYSWLLGYADDPGNSGINPLGPLVAALLVSAAGGWKNFKAVVGTMVRVRSHWSTYAFAFLLPILLAVISLAIMAALGVHFPIERAMARWTDLIDAFLIMLLFVALGEEPGWRGWLMPRLKEHMTPLMASLALAPVWALWHLPMLGEELPVNQLIPFLLSLTSASIVLTWLTLRTKGGVLPAMICHATVNAIGGSFLFTFYSGADTTSLRWINGLLWVVAALAVTMLTRGRLGAGSGHEK